MELVIDANIIISALIARKNTLDLIFSDELRLFAPEFLLEEIEKHRSEILAKSGLSNEDFQVFLSLISSRINLINESLFEEFTASARVMCPDINDTKYFALALKLKCAIWSNDKQLKIQDKIRVYSTKDLLESL